MIFGDQLTAAATTASAAWIEPACRRTDATVGNLVPNDYSSFLRVRPPPPISGDWWATYRNLYEAVAAIGARHTSRADGAWFAVWEGHGFDSVHVQVAWSDPPIDDTERQAREATRARLRRENRTRTAAIRAELATVPRFALPDRTYYLMEGPVAAVMGMRFPSTGAGGTRTCSGLTIVDGSSPPTSTSGRFTSGGQRLHRRACARFGHTDRSHHARHPA